MYWREQRSSRADDPIHPIESLLARVSTISVREEENHEKG
jgi:hypothetical protein